MRKLKEDAFILRTNTGDLWQVEEGHTLEEYRKLFGDAYDDGELWDFSEEDVKAGAVEANPNMVYWRIKIGDEPRYFETTIFDEWNIHECREEMCKDCEKLEEGTSNFPTRSDFDLLVFYTMDEFYDRMRYDSNYPDEDDFEHEDEQGHYYIDWEAYDDAKEKFEQEYWDNNNICVLDEDEVERLENKLFDFNKETQRIADRRWEEEVSDEEYNDLSNLEDIKLDIKPGYYEAAYIDVENEDSLNYIRDQLANETRERIENFLKELRSEFGLTKLGVAWGPASNGETGYKVINDSLKKEKIEESKERYEIEYWVDEEARDQGLGDIAIETFDNLEDAKEFADKLFGEVASVEVLDSKKNVVYGRYPEDESLKEEKECFFEIVFKEKGDEEEKTERYEDDFDGARADFLHMTQDERDNYQYVVLRKVCTDYNSEEDIEVIDSFGLDESLKEEKIEEAPENPSTHLGYKENGEEVIKQAGHAYLLKKGNRYIVRYAPGYYVNDIKASSDEEAINKFLGLDESIQKLAERKSKRKLKFRFTGDPAKDAVFFNHCQGTDVGDVGVEASSVSLGEEEKVCESQEDYYVVSDGKNPKHSYVFSENGRETAIGMLKDYKGNGYWEVLHYVNGNPKMIYNTKDGEVEEK